MPRISVHIVAWNSARVLPEALESLRAQTFKDFALIVVDNASTDTSVDVVRELFPDGTVLRNFKNLGFSRAHNQAIEMARGRWALDDRQGRSSIDRYALVMNPDVILKPDYLEKLLAGVDRRPEIASACGKLLRVLPRLEEHDDPRVTDVFDSAGLVVRRDRRAGDRAAGETDKGQYDTSEEVFGVSGALALYRAEALDAAAEANGGQAFDEDMFAYKEDVDLAWRLRLLGWKAAYVPEAVAYHYRGAKDDARAGLFKRLTMRRGRSVFVNRLSTRNHAWLLAKNEDTVNFLLHGVLILPYELGKFLGVLLLSPQVLPAYLEALWGLPRMWRKRRSVMKRRKTPANEIRKWFK